MARTFFHIVLGALMWVVFGYYWYLVVQQPVTEHTKNALAIVGIIIAAITLFDVFWILHNIRVSKNGKRRTRALPLSVACRDSPFCKSMQAACNKLPTISRKVVAFTETFRPGGFRATFERLALR